MRTLIVLALLVLLGTVYTSSDTLPELCSELRKDVRRYRRCLRDVKSLESCDSKLSSERVIKRQCPALRRKDVKAVDCEDSVKDFVSASQRNCKASQTPPVPTAPPAPELPKFAFADMCNFLYITQYLHIRSCKHAVNEAIGGAGSAAVFNKLVCPSFRGVQGADYVSACKAVSNEFFANRGQIKLTPSVLPDNALNAAHRPRSKSYDIRKILDSLYGTSSDKGVTRSPEEQRELDEKVANIKPSELLRKILNGLYGKESYNGDDGNEGDRTDWVAKVAEYN